MDACSEATEAINKTNRESWKDLLQEAILKSDGSNMWQVIQGLNGTPDTNSPNEAMSHNHHTITNSKYFHTPLCPGSANLTCHKLIKTSTVNSKNNSIHHLLMMKDPLQMDELLSAIKKMK